MKIYVLCNRNSYQLINTVSYESIEYAKLAEKEYIYSTIEGMLCNQNDIEKYIQINNLKKISLLNFIPKDFKKEYYLKFKDAYNFIPNISWKQFLEETMYCINYLNFFNENKHKFIADILNKEVFITKRYKKPLFECLLLNIVELQLKSIFE